MEAAGRHDREDRFLGLLRFFLIGEGKQSFGGGEKMRPAASSAVERIAASSRKVFTSKVISSETVRPFSALGGVARPLTRRFTIVPPRPAIRATP
jgi:hypothetical protein